MGFAEKRPSPTPQASIPGCFCGASGLCVTCPRTQPWPRRWLGPLSFPGALQGPAHPRALFETKGAKQPVLTQLDTTAWSSVAYLISCWVFSALPDCKELPDVINPLTLITVLHSGLEKVKPGGGSLRRLPAGPGLSSAPSHLPPARTQPDRFWPVSPPTLPTHPLPVPISQPELRPSACLGCPSPFFIPAGVSPILRG